MDRRGTHRSPRADLRWREVDGAVIVLDLRSSEYLALNSTGSFLWSILGDDGADPSELAAALVERYEISPEQASADVAAFLEHCTAKGLFDAGS